jgi:hypothetical protein
MSSAPARLAPKGPLHQINAWQVVRQAGKGRWRATTRFEGSITACSGRAQEAAPPGASASTGRELHAGNRTVRSVAVPVDLLVEDLGVERFGGADGTGDH